MPSEKWVCDICSEPFDSEEEAQECEDIHNGKVDPINAYRERGLQFFAKMRNEKGNNAQG